MKQANINWHPAFVEAIQLELKEYGDALEFYPEFQLTSEPLQIDCVVIKKVKDTVIKKNIAAIFREVNILEYKGPDHYVSVADFYKVYAYTCLYASFEKVPITNMTITFVENHYPRKLIAHFRDVRKYTVEKKSSGIYTVSGDVLAIQVIDSRKLTVDENIWLKSLSKRLEPSLYQRLNDEIVRQGKEARIGAYLDAIVRSNVKAIREAIKMRNNELTIEQVFEEVGWIAKWKAEGEVKGEERKAVNIAKNMVKLGYPLEAVVSATELEPEKVKELYPG